MDAALRPGVITQDYAVPTEPIPSGQLIIQSLFMGNVPASRTGQWLLRVECRLLVYNPLALIAPVTLTLSAGGIPSSDEWTTPATAAAGSILRTLTLDEVILLSDGNSTFQQVIVYATAAGMSIEALNSQSQQISWARLRVWPI